ncbi:reverse transcriptase domain-containing protein [Tanacetum coccineum]
MRTRSQTRNRNRQQQSQPAVVQPFHLEEPFVNPPLVPMADNRTMAQLLQAPTEGYEDAIVIPEINANFELKHGLINLVQNKQFFGHDKEDPHAHIRYFNKITSTMRFPDIPSTSIKLMLFPFSLEDTFYNALNANDQDSLNSAAGGNFLDKMPRECLRIIESKSKVRNSRNKAVVAKVSSNSSTPGISPDVGVSELKNMMKTLLSNTTNSQASRTQIQGVSKPIFEKLCIKAYDAVLRNYANQGQSARCLNPKPSIPYPSRRNDERHRENANEQKEKFYEIFKDMSFEISFMDALTLMPKFASTLKALIGNKEKLSEMARTPLNEHCSACLALADLGASINLMPFSVWKKLNLPDLTPTCMTLELADRSISRPIGIAKDVNVKVGVFQFPADFVSDKDGITYYLDQTSRYSVNYNDMTTNRIDVVELACEEYSQEVLGFSDVIDSGNPTPGYDPIVSNSSPTLTPFGDSDFLLLEEADAFLALADDPNFKEELKICEAKTAKSSIDEPPEVELKDLPPHLEYAFLEDNNKLPVIIAKDLSVDEKTALIKVLKSRKQAIAWKLSDIKGYFSNTISIEDQEKTTFTCPYGTFAYRRMPFGLCNAPGTFQRCMMAIFYDMIEKTMEPELSNDPYILCDHVVHPIDPYYKRKTRSAHGMKTCRSSNPSSSSNVLDHPSLSHHVDENDDGNDEESFHSNTPSPSQLINSLSNVVSRVFETPPQYRDEHQKGLRSIGRALKNAIKGSKK